MDAKYATWDNVTGKPLTGTQANRIGRHEGFVRGPGEGAGKGRILWLGLLLWDGYRPQRARDPFCAGQNSRRMPDEATTLSEY